MILETPDTVKKMFNYDWLRFYKIIGLNTSINGGRQDFEIELENKKITDVNFDFAQNGDLIVAGLFSRPVGNKYPNRNIHGCFTKRIEINTKRIIWENETLFNKSIIAATMGVQSANLDLGTTNNFCLMDIPFIFRLFIGLFNWRKFRFSPVHWKQSTFLLLQFTHCSQYRSVW
jgi:hypothetical protein